MKNLFFRLLILLRLKPAWKVVAYYKTSSPPYEKFVSCVATGKYKKEYMKGEVVEAEPGTLGLLCFLTKLKAHEWAEVQRVYLDLVLDLKKVRPYGFGKRPRRVCYIPGFAIGNSTTKELLDYFYSKNLKPDKIKPPPQTVGYKKIKVLK